jgi:hypothetical protein
MTRDVDDDMPPYLRALLVEWRRVRIREANELSRMLGLPPVRTSRAKKADDERP